MRHNEGQKQCVEAKNMQYNMELDTRKSNHFIGHYAGQMARAYLKSHPWINFGLDLRPAGRKLWLHLGEAQSKCEHIAGYPLRPDFAERLHAVYLAKGVLATTAIEGNTLSEEEVMAHLQGKLQLPPSREYLRQEIDNMLELANDLVDKAQAGDRPLVTPDLLGHFNRTILRNLTVDEDTTPGEIRKDSRVVGRYRCPPADDCDHLLEKFCAWLNGPELALEEGSEIVCGVIRAVVAHVYFVWIHPFGDGNGRTARLLEVKLLLDAGVPSNACHLLSNYYNKTRAEYYRQLDVASKHGGNLLPIIEYAVGGFVEELREQISIIREQHLDITWVNYVHDRFRDKTSTADRRRRMVVLAISNYDSVKLNTVAKLTPEIATEYAGRSDRSVARDLNHLQEMGLIQRVKGARLRARKENILKFLPARKVEED